MSNLRKKTQHKISRNYREYYRKVDIFFGGKKRKEKVDGESIPVLEGDSGDENLLNRGY